MTGGASSSEVMLAAVKIQVFWGGLTQPARAWKSNPSSRRKCARMATGRGGAGMIVILGGAGMMTVILGGAGMVFVG